MAVALRKRTKAIPVMNAEIGKIRWPRHMSREPPGFKHAASIQAVPGRQLLSSALT